jgi:hypothetical protein
MIKYIKNFSLKPVYLICFLYALVWTAPLILSTIVSIFGFNFSYIGREWQHQNIFLIMWVVISSFFTAIFSGLIFIKFFSRYPINLLNHNKLLFAKSLKPNSVIFSTFILGISGFGLFKSFGGTSFSVNYIGPINTWLAVGAWSSIYLITLGLIVGNFFVKYGINFKIIIFSFLCFIPILICGSRIDFLSFMIAINLTILFISNKKILHRYISVLIISTFSLFICIYIGQLRYTYVNFSEILLFPAVITEKKMFYMSTFGDISSSLFELTGRLESHQISFVGLSEYSNNYFIRLAPGFILDNRPGEIANSLTRSNIGGGAVHSLADGYLALGFLGCFIVSFFIGFLGALSGFFLERYKKFPSAYNWLFFAFPWLFIIRGGWYQFFAFFKSLEILFIFILAIYTINIFFRKLRLSP